jgi:1-deoxy-D-xylulose-5-phosphate reductoisomerase
LDLAFEAMHRGGNAPCVLNGANEVAVKLFLEEKIGFLQIPEVVEHAMNSVPFIEKPVLHDYFESDAAARLAAGSAHGL